MPKGNPGVKRPNFHPSNECIQRLKDNNIKRGLETKKMWEQIALDNKLTCRTCEKEKSLDLFNPRNHPDYKMWVTECKECENKRKDIVYKKRVLEKGLEWNINQILRGVYQRSNKTEKEIDIDTTYLVKLYNDQNGICAYSGRKMSFDINSQERLSLDRKDSSLGYIKSNVVWCCWTANNIKQDLSIDDFKRWIGAINTIMNSS